MPPRRSSRAASASLPTPIETLPIKRKRGQTLEPHNVDLEEDDDIGAKPKRGKRGSSVVKPSRPSRQSSRAANASLETAPVGTLPIKPKKGQTIQSHILEEEEMKLEEEEEVDVNLKRAGSPNDNDEEAPPIPNGRRTTPKPKASIQQSDDEMDAMSSLSEVEEDEDVKPIRKGRKVPTARKAKATTKKTIKTTVIEDSDDDDSDIQAPPAAQPRSQRHNGDANVVSNTSFLLSPSQITYFRVSLNDDTPYLQRKKIPKKHHYLTHPRCLDLQVFLGR